MAKTKIVLDPGHGKYDNPSKVKKEWVVEGLYEGTNNYEAVQMLKEELETYQDVEIIVTRKSINDNPDLPDRGAMGRDADLFYSWHSNGVDDTADAHGVSSFSSVRRDGKALCESISKAVVAVFKECGSKITYDRGYSQRCYNKALKNIDYYGVLRSATLSNPNAVLYGSAPKDTTCKNAIIIEHGFHTNPVEGGVLNNHAYLKKIVQAEAKVIAEYFKLKKKDPEPTPTPTPTDYRYFAVISANINKKYAEEDVAKAKKLGFTDAYVKYAPKDGAL